MSRIASIQGKSIRSTGKINKLSAKALAALSAAAAMVGWSAAAKADTFGNLYSSYGNQTLLASTTAWLDETAGGTDLAPPGVNDIAQFDANTGLTAPTTFNLGQASTSWAGLSVLNPGNAVIIDDAGQEAADSLTLGLSGINVGSQNLTINDSINVGASQSWSVASGQSLTVNGIITGTGNTLSFTGGGTTILTGSSAYTGTTSANTNLVLNFAAAGAPATNILNSGSALLLGGGNFTVHTGATAASQSIANVTIGAAPVNINLTSSGAGAPTLNIGTLALASTSAGGYMVINGVPTIGAGNILVNGVGTLILGTNTVAPGNTSNGAANGNAANGIVEQPNGTANVGGALFATVGLYDWPAVTGTAGAYNVVGGSTVSNFYTPFGSTNSYSYPSGTVAGIVNITNSFTGNADIVANAGTHNTDTFPSIRFNTPGTVLVNGVPTITLAVSSVTDVGGVLVTPNVGASDVTINGTAEDFEAGTRNAGGASELIIYQYNTLGLMNISSGLGNSKSGSSSFLQAGPGAITFGNTSTYEGSTYLDGGITEIGNNGDLGAGTDAI